MQVTTRTMQVQGHRVSVGEVGEGSPLLVVNGSGANLEMLTPLMERLAGTHHVVAFDQPGMGRSAARCPTLGVPELASLACGVLDQLGIRSADILGYSFGGAVAQHMALVAPARVNKLVLVSSMCGIGSVPPDPLALSAALAHIWRLPGLDRHTAAWAFGGVVGTSEKAYHDFRRRAARAFPDPVSYAGQAVAISSWSSLPWLWAITKNTLVIAGGADRSVPPVNAYVLASLLPRAQLQVLPGAGHLLLLDQADDVARLVETFLTR